MSKDSNIKIFRQYRKAILMAVGGVGLDAEQVAEISSIFDAFDPSAKYKKGAIVSYGDVIYRCIKNTASGSGTPDVDADHWERVDAAADGVEVWSADKAGGYSKGDRVHYPDADGPIYVSQKNNNGVEPSTDEKYWTIETGVV